MVSNLTTQAYQENSFYQQHFLNPVTQELRTSCEHLLYLLLSHFTTEHLYHNCSQHVHMYFGQRLMFLWNRFIINIVFLSFLFCFVLFCSVIFMTCCCFSFFWFLRYCLSSSFTCSGLATFCFFFIFLFFFSYLPIFFTSFNIVLPSFPQVFILCSLKLSIISFHFHVFSLVSSTFFISIDYFLSKKILTTISFVWYLRTFFFCCRNIMSFTYMLNINVSACCCNIHWLNNSNRSKSFIWFSNMLTQLFIYIAYFSRF